MFSNDLTVKNAETSEPEWDWCSSSYIVDIYSISDTAQMFTYRWRYTPYQPVHIEILIFLKHCPYCAKTPSKRDKNHCLNLISAPFYITNMWDLQTLLPIVIPDLITIAQGPPLSAPERYQIFPMSSEWRSAYAILKSLKFSASQIRSSKATSHSCTPCSRVHKPSRLGYDECGFLPFQSTSEY